MSVPLSYYLALSVVLFFLGAAVNLAFVGFADAFQAVDGQMFVFFAMTVAAAEVAVGLALVVVIFRNRATVYADDLNILKW
ncbi:MAG: NADH-quinone oxidoreductase subunit NuoK [Deltaproteobacteria bacterium]|nr:NADH-quinone oxidoreductase subunit NuoK [Deltaproteobacteria bacterium]